MVLERNDTEILVRLPIDIDISELQNMLDYLKYIELTSNSIAKQSDSEKLSKSANKSMSQKFIEKRQNCESCS